MDRIVNRLGEVDWAEVYNLVAEHAPRLYEILQALGWRGFAEAVVAEGIHTIVGIGPFAMIEFASDVLSDIYGEKQVKQLVGKKRKELPTAEDQAVDGLKRGKWVISGDTKQVTVENGQSENVAPSTAMSNYTSYPLTRCCVDLGALNPSMKKDVADPHLTGDLRSYKYATSGIINSDKDKFFFGPLRDGITENNPAGANSYPTWTQNPGPGFNSVRQLDTIFADLGLSGAVYNGAGNNSDKINDPGDSHQTVVLTNQSYTIHFKNVNYGVDSNHETPLFLNVYLVQFKNDIYSPDITVGNTANILGQWLNGGWEQTYSQAAGNEISDGTTPQIDMFYGLRENYWFQENVRIVDGKKFCLAPGQEGIMRMMLKPPQILSFQHRIRPVFRSTNELQFPAFKKGEQTLLIQFHGGVSSYDGKTAVAMEPAKLLYYAYGGYHAGLYSTERNLGYNEVVGNIPSTTAQDNDTDIHGHE